MDLLNTILAGIDVRSPVLTRMNVAGGASVDMIKGPGLPFHYAISGEIQIETETAMHSLAPGDLVIFPKWDQHIVHFNGGGPVESILDIVTRQNLPLWSAREYLETPLEIAIGSAPFGAQLFSGNTFVNTEETAFITASLPEMITLRSDQSTIQGAVNAVWQLVLEEMDSQRAGFGAVAARALELLIVQALRSWLLGAGHPPGWARGAGHDNIRRALQAMYDEPGREWTLTELAEEAGQSRSAFAVTFKDTMGETPFVHLRRLRMHLAANRLHHSRKSIAAIAAELGYANNYALARAFKQETGVTAMTFRRRARKESDVR